MTPEPGDRFCSCDWPTAKEGDCSGCTVCGLPIQCEWCEKPVPAVEKYFDMYACAAHKDAALDAMSWLS